MVAFIFAIPPSFIMPSRNPSNPILGERVMTQSVASDDRLQDLYARRAEITFDLLASHYSEMAAKDEGVFKEEDVSSSETKWSYPVTMTVLGLGVAATLRVMVFDEDRSNRLVTFTGQGAGLILGAGTTWGRIVLDTPIEKQVGLEANFECHLWTVWTEVNFFTLRNRYYASADGGGIGLGTGIFGGKGYFLAG
jgi:Rhodococcus equi virulence-associated protein